MSGAKPHVLICIDWYLPGFKGGGPIRSVANLVKALHHDYDFSIITSDTDYGAESPYPGIVPDEWTQGEGCRIWYCSREGSSYRHIRGLIAKGEWDILYLNSVFSLRFTIFPLWTGRAAFPEKKVVLAPRGMLHAGALALKPRKKKLFLAALRFMGFHKHIRFHATDAQEVLDIEKVFGKGLDVVLSQNLPQSVDSPQPLLRKVPGKLSIVFVSRISEKKGVLELLEALQAQTAEISLDLHGPDEEPGYWARCQKLIDSLPSNVSVQKHGALPPDAVPSVLGRHHLFAMPTRGENFGHAIFEALAAGRPVLISDQTPWEGLEAAKAGLALPLKFEQGWADAIARFAAMDESEWAEWAEGAFAYAEAHVAGGDVVADARALFVVEETQADAHQGK